MPTPSRYYSSSAAKTTLAGSISAIATSLELTAASNLPSQYPYTLILEKDTANEEVIEITGLVGTFYTIGTRGVDSSGAKAHTIGAAVEHGVSARDFTESRAHEVAGTSHGVSGSIVGTTDSQTLSNKTLSTGNVYSANQSAGGFKITNLGTPTTSTDAATKAYADTTLTAAATSATSAATSATSAATSASSAATSAASAAAGATSATSAATSATSAAASATAAATSATSASTQATAAATSATSAATSRTSALTSQTSAATSATSASTSASSAATSATSAAASATTASNSAATATTSASNAATSATSAATSATSAATSVTSAATQATAAATSATSAATSATSAATSATSAAAYSTLTTGTTTAATYTFALTDKDDLFLGNSASAQTFSIPTNATAFSVGSQINVLQIGAGQITITALTPGTTTVLSNGATAASPKLRTRYSSCTLIKTATENWYVIGDIV